MALNINNTLQPQGMQTSTPATNTNGYVSPGSVNQAVPSLSAGLRTTIGNIGQAILPSATYKPYQAPITGLVSPSHPAVGSLNTGSPIATHTVTTNPDNSTTSKVTYDNSSSTETGGSSNSTTTTPPTTPPTTLPPAPVAPIAQSAFQVDPSTLPGLTGGNYGNGTGAQQQNNGNPYTPQLASVSAGGSPAAQGYTSQTAGYGAGNLPIGATGAGIGSQYAQDVQQAISPYIKLAQGQATTGTTPVAQGNELATLAAANQLGTQLTNAGNLALSGNAQALTGQNQAANATNEAAGQALGQQQTEQSGLGTAAGYGQPQTAAYGQTVFNPTTGQYTGGGGLPSDVLQQYAQMAANGQYSAIPSAITSNPVLSAQLNAAATQINPSYNPIASTAQGQAAATNIGAAGTAVTGANAQGLAQSIQQETALNTAANNAAALATQVSTALTNSGLDMTNSTDANTAINNLQSRLGNAAYTQLNVAVNDARNAYGAILQATGATPTDAGNAANQNINANMSPKQILAAIDQLSQGVNARQQSQHQQTQQYQKQLAASGSGGSTGSSSVNYNW